MKKNETLNDLWIWVMDHKKKVMPVVLLLCVLLTVLFAMNANRRAERAASVNAQDAGSFEVPVTQAAVNAYPEVNTLIRDYYDAWAAGDMDTIDRLYRSMTQTERLTTMELSNYIEDVQGVDVYTKPGPVDGSYVVYAHITVKFHDYDEPVSGVHAFYVCTDEDGTLYLNSENSDDNVKEYIREISLQNDVIDLYNSVAARFNEMRSEDEQLDELLSSMLGNVSITVGEALATNMAGKEEDGTQVASAGISVIETELPESVTGSTSGTTAHAILRATDVVNIRTSDSETADKIAKTAEGDEFTQLEARANGWSKIAYEGGEAFVKTEFFEVVGSVDMPAPVAVEEENAATAETSTQVTSADTSTGAVTAASTAGTSTGAGTTASTAGTSTGSVTAATASTSASATSTTTSTAASTAGTSTGASTTASTTGTSTGAATAAGTITTPGNYYIKETTRIRKSASTTSDIVDVAYEKNPIEVLNVMADGWSKVKYQGKEGYCMTQYLTE